MLFCLFSCLLIKTGHPWTMEGMVSSTIYELIHTVTMLLMNGL